VELALVEMSCGGVYSIMCSLLEPSFKTHFSGQVCPENLNQYRLLLHVRDASFLYQS
jgi:hypothetical protein